MTTMTYDQGKDARKPGWFWADNCIIDRYAVKVGVHGVAVYMMLVRHLNRDGECWPSTATIARTLGISQRTVVTSIKRLVAENLVEVTERAAEKKGQISNLYTIHRVDPSAPDAPPPMQEMHTPPMQEMHRGADNALLQAQSEQ